MKKRVLSFRAQIKEAQLKVEILLSQSKKVLGVGGRGGGKIFQGKKHHLVSHFPRYNDGVS